MKQAPLFVMGLFSLSIFGQIAAINLPAPAKKTGLKSSTLSPRGTRRTRPLASTSRGFLPLPRLELDPSLLDSPKAIWVEKAAHRLTLYENGAVVQTFLISIGRNESAAKVHRNDWATPEGMYSISEKNPESKYHLALLINYPNAKDADRGLATGLINQNQYAEIMNAHAKGITPLQDTRLGGWVEIHGGSNRVKQTETGETRLAGWTRGCMGLRNTDIDKIYDWADAGTPVWITP